MKKTTIGNFQFEYDNGDLFRVFWQGTQVIQKIYMAVRDEAWNTIPAKVTNVQYNMNEEFASVSFEARNSLNDIELEWKGEIRATSQNKLVFGFRGTALRQFKFCKIGFNIHHGLEAYSGLPFTCKTESGDYIGRFTREIIPQLVKDGTLTAMTPPYDELRVNFPNFDGLFRFTGDLFEMQDHRNWADDNWKSYGTPLSKGFPFQASLGDTFEQQIEFEILDSSFVQVASEMDEPRILPPKLPKIGVDVKELISNEVLISLKKLSLDFLRTSLSFSKPDWDLFDAVVKSAKFLNCGIEVVIYLPEKPSEADVKKMIEVFFEVKELISRLVVLTEKSGYSAFQGATSPELSSLVSKLLPADAHFPIFSGTDQFFSDVNRARPDYSGIDGVVFALNPQVHSGDALSIMQNATPIEDIAMFINTLYPGKAIAVSPVEFLGEFGPFPLGPQREDGLPANIDPRFSSSLGTAWTCAFIGHASQSHISSLTLFEVTGPRGILASKGEYTEISKLLGEILSMRAEGYTLTKVEFLPDNERTSLFFSTSDGKNTKIVMREVSST